jgi:iron complex transport system substrate-binding protein
VVPGVTRRSAVALMVVGVLSVTACGSSGTEVEEPAAATQEETRSVTHALGTTEIVGTPERVVVLDTGELDSVLALGITPVGAVTTDVSEGFLSYLAEDAEGVEVVGTVTEPDLEAVAALEPDLILSSKVRHEELYAQLSQLAPTVFAETVGGVWKDNLLLDAEALGLEEEAEAALSEYEQRAAELGESLGDAADTTVSSMRFVSGTIRVYTAESFIGTVLADVGVAQLQLPTTDVPTFAELSAEELTRADADVVLYSSYGPATDSGEQVAVAGPLWERLAAVRADRAFAVEDDVFYTGIGLTAANLQVDALEELLLTG